MKKYIVLLILIITNIVTVLYFSFQDQKQKYVVATVIKKIAGDTIVITKEIFKPKPVYVYDNHVPVFLDPDSCDVFDSLIKNDYYRSYTYSDTIVNDSSLFISVSDSVSQNKLASQKVNYQNRRLTQVITNVYTPAEIKKYSILIGANYIEGVGLAPSLMLQSNRYYISAAYKDGVYCVGFGYKLLSF